MNKSLIAKGSIAIDGVSLTIHELSENRVVVKLIPETLAATGLGGLEAGSAVNIELDMLVKTIQQSMRRILDQEKGVENNEQQREF